MEKGTELMPTVSLLSATRMYAFGWIFIDEWGVLAAGFNVRHPSGWLWAVIRCTHSRNKVGSLKKSPVWICPERGWNALSNSSRWIPVYSSFACIPFGPTQCKWLCRGGRKEGTGEFAKSWLCWGLSHISLAEGHLPPHMSTFLP